MPLIVEKVVSAFKNMDFGEANESTSLAEEWLRKKGINLETTLEYVTKPHTEMKDANNKFDSVLDKYNFFQEVISELKKNVRLIAELEMLVRGFTYWDAMKSINLFMDFLSFHSISMKKEVGIMIPKDISLAYLGQFLTRYDCFNNNAPFFVDAKLGIILTAIKEIIQVPCEKYKVEMLLYSNDNVTVHSKKTPVLVFSGADLDSACESIVNAAFSEQGLMPWSVNTVLVQEDILADVNMKLKHRLEQIKIGRGVDKQADFSVPILLGDYEAKFKEALAAAASKGIEVFQPQNGNMTALFIGGKVFNNSVLPKEQNTEEQRIPFVNVMAFRSIKEAAALCNNQQQTFAAGVWANDVSLVHEIVRSLNVNTIWVNCHGVFHPSAQIILDKSECGVLHEEILKQFETVQPAWAKKTEQQRINILRNIAGALASKVDMKNKSMQKLIEALLLVKLDLQQQPAASNVQVYGTYELKQFKEPVGVVCVDKFEEAVTALALGNGVILQLSDDSNISEPSRKFFDDVAMAIPGLLQIKTENNFSLNQDLCIYKNVWTAIGENYV